MLELIAGIEHEHSPKHHEWYHGHRDGPYGSSAVLEHGEQCAGDSGQQRHAVEHDNHDITYRKDAAGIDVEDIPPHMAQH